jgi:hypothetical protein
MHEMFGKGTSNANYSLELNLVDGAGFGGILIIIWYRGVYNI